MNKRNILLALVAVLVIIQFFPIDKTNPPSDPASDFLAMETPPAPIAKMIKDACYDCHSHHTAYPWYADYQPVGWWLRSHYRGARKHLNFSEWKAYSEEEKQHVLREVVEVIENGQMPIKSYTWMHPEAKLTEGQKTELVTYFRGKAGG